MNEYIKYNTVSEFLIDMINNDGEIFYDRYGRRWKYSHYMFYFADINKDFDSNNLDCLHLFQAGIKRGI